MGGIRQVQSFVLLCIYIVRVIDSPLLWDNRTPTRKNRSVFYLVPHTVMLGLVVTVGLIIFDIQKPSYKQPLSQSHVAAAQTVLKPAAHVAGKSISLETFLPETDNPSSFLINKLAAIPPPQATPNCIIEACVALTFDDGPNPESTPLILDTLKKEQAHATFFEIGRLVGGNEAYLRRMHDEGNEVGNHSWAHPDFTKISAPLIDQQIQQTQAVIAAAGIPAPTLFRPPYGSINAGVLKQIHMPVILWNVDPKDWAQKDSDSVTKIVEQQIKPGAIIVMHDKKITAGALDKILQDSKGKYKFVTVSQLLNLAPSSLGVYVGR